VKRSIFIAVVLLLISTLGYADDFASGKPNTPEGEIGGINSSGGNVGSAGLGIQADEFSGAATFMVPISLPPGRSGLTPKLSLNYHSMRKNPGSWVGLGWELSLGSIVRVPKYGIVDYYAGAEFEVQLLGKTERLKRVKEDASASAYGLSIPAGTTVDLYEARVDNSRNIYLHLYNKTNPEKIKDLGWVVIDKNGTRYEFGTFPGQNFSQDYALSPDLKQTWVAGWFLETITDANGNVVKIEYGIDLHPNKITYGDVIVQFIKTGFEKLHFFPIFREGFFAPQKVSQLNAIEVWNEQNQRLLKYELLHSKSGTNRAPLLTTIKRLGATDNENLPPITLSYFGNDKIAFQQEPTVVKASTIIDEKENPFNAGYLGNYADILDMNGDGLADILTGFKNGTFAVRAVSGVVNYGLPVMLTDPMAGKCIENASKQSCWGLVSGVVQSGNSIEWSFIMDMNGDGAPDRVLRTNNDFKKPPYFLIAFGIPGKFGWDATLVEWADPMTANNPGIEDHSAGLMDMNGDGLPDRIVGDAKAGGFNVYLNNGFGFSSKPTFWKDPRAVAVPANTPDLGKIDAYEGDKLYLTIRDVTGDGLPDRVYRTEFISPDGANGWKSEFGFSVAANKNGLGWAQPQVVQNQNECQAGKICTKVNSYDMLGMADPLTIKNEQGYISSQTYDLIDFNNDGYADRVQGFPYTGAPDTGKIHITYFAGQSGNASKLYFDPLTAVIIDDPVFDDKSKAWAAAGYLSRRYQNYQFTMTRDVNGDGYPDRLVWTPRDGAGITAEPYKSRSIEIHPLVVNPLQFSTLIDVKTANQPVNALKEIDNGEGMKTAVEYIHSTDPDLVKNRYLPTPVTLVHRLYRTSTDAPIDNSPEGQRHPGMRWASYYYEGGNLYLRYGKTGNGSPDKEYQSRFNGFQSVTKWHKPFGNETWSAYAEKTTFYQSKGDLIGKMPNEGEFDDFHDIALSGLPTYREIREGQAVRMRQYWYWGLASAPKDDNPDCDYSSCRPQLNTEEKRIYEVGSQDSHGLKSKYEYDKEGNIASKSTLVQMEDNLYKLARGIYSEFYPASTFKSGLSIRNRLKSQTIGNKTTINRKVVFEYDDKGNPTLEKQYSDSATFLKTSRKFDQYGNVIEWTGQDGVTHTHTYDTNKVFPVAESITLPGGQVLTTQRAYHRTTGKITQELNPYGVGNLLTLDSFGRPIEEHIIAAGGNKTLLHKWSYDYLQDIPLLSTTGTILKTQMWESQPGYAMNKPWQITYTDGNGRMRQSCTMAESTAHRRIQSRTQNAGRVQIQTAPEFDFNGCPLLFDLATVTTTATHDLFGRPVTIQPPPSDNGSPTASTLIAYTTEFETGYLVRKTTLPNGNVRTEKFNSINQLEFVDEGTTGTSASYKYNYASDLESVTVGNKTQMTASYDWLGRKKTTTDADMGAWSYDYDTLGRLKTQTDAKGQKIGFDYDAIGRLVKKEYFNSSTIEKSENYSYDAGAAGFDVLPGELSQVIEKNGNKETVRSSSFSYDSSYRRMAKMERAIPNVGNFTQTLFNNYKGQLTSTIYPGGKTIYQKYHANGGLLGVCKTADCSDFYYHLDTVHYDAYGAIINETFGNEVEVKNNFYPNTHRLQSRTILRNGKVYTKREYQYNTLSSLTQIADPLDQVGSGAMSGITYDGQDRLVGYQTKTGAAVGFSYATNGNILSNGDSYSGKTYTYASPRPHAVTQIGSDTFDYDANGNMVKDASRAMAYSAANQLTQVKMTNGGVVDMDYDFTGARVLKKSIIKDVNGKTWQTVTHYLGEAVEIKLAPIELGADGKPVSPLASGETPKGTTLLHISANGQRIATMTLGTLADILKPAAGTVWGLPYNQLPPLAAAALLLALLIVHFPRKFPLPQGERVRVRVYTITLPRGGGLGRGGRAVAALFLIVVQITSPPLALAGDSGTPALPASDTDYLVYYHGDHLSSAQLITEGKTRGKHAGITYLKGDVIQRFEYAAYGRENFALNPNLSWDPAFTGQKYDIETGLYYYRARYYNPLLGRFIQADTIVQNTYDPQSWNRYAYVRNNPLKYTDPTGNMAEYDPATDSFSYSADKPTLGVADAFNEHAEGVRDQVDRIAIEGGLISAVIEQRSSAFSLNDQSSGASSQYYLSDISHFPSRKPGDVFGNYPLFGIQVRSDNGNTSHHRFGHVRSGGKRFHAGIDLLGQIGDLVFSVGEGKVVESRSSKTYGNMVVIDHGGVSTIYAHLRELSDLKTGEKVSAGEIIGHVGRTGNVSTDPNIPTHLHFGVIESGKPLTDHSAWKDPDYYYSGGIK
jgi:RHS repeat-associated protein